MSCWHREKDVWKTYFVRVMGTLGDNEVECLEKGVDIGEDKLTRPAKVRCLDKKELIWSRESRLSGRGRVLSGAFHL